MFSFCPHMLFSFLRNSFSQKSPNTWMSNSGPCSNFLLAASFPGYLKEPNSTSLITWVGKDPKDHQAQPSAEAGHVQLNQPLFEILQWSTSPSELVHTEATNMIHLLQTLLRKQRTSNFFKHQLSVDKRWKQIQHNFKNHITVLDTVAHKVGNWAHSGVEDILPTTLITLARIASSEGLWAVQTGQEHREGHSCPVLF